MIMFRGIPWERPAPRTREGRSAAAIGAHPSTEVVTALMSARLSIDSIVSVAPEQLSCALGDESAILNMKNSVYYGLDPVGTRIWSLIQQRISVRELRNRLMDEYEVGADQCEGDLLSLLEKMRNEGLIRVEGPDPD